MAYLIIGIMGDSGEWHEDISHLISSLRITVLGLLSKSYSLGRRLTARGSIRFGRSGTGSRAIFSIMRDSHLFNS